MTTMKVFVMIVVAAALFCSHHVQVTVAKRTAKIVVNYENESLKSQIKRFSQWWPIPWIKPIPGPSPRPKPKPQPRSPPPPPPSPPPPPPSPPPPSPPPPPPSPPPPSPPPPPPSPPPPSPPPPPPSPPPPSPPPSPPPPSPPPPTPPPPTPFPGCSASDKEKVKTCMFNTTSIDECCPTFKSILGTSCPCYQYAEDLDNQVLITIESYCDIDSPCRYVPSPPDPFSGCSTSEKEQVKTCMSNTTSIDECCPIFKKTLGTNCPCYKYAEDLDNQALITLESYCDIESPCTRVPSPPPPDPFSGCWDSEKEQVKKCMFNTTSIDECCPIFKETLGLVCPCYKYAEDLDNEALITLENYCDIHSPCKSVQVI